MSHFTVDCVTMSLIIATQEACASWSGPAKITLKCPARKGIRTPSADQIHIQESRQCCGAAAAVRWCCLEIYSRSSGWTCVLMYTCSPAERQKGGGTWLWCQAVTSTLALSLSPVLFHPHGQCSSSKVH